MSGDELILNSLTRITGRIHRHGPGDQQTPVCGATRLGRGMWLTVWDRGAYGGEVYGKYQGSLVLVDLWLHVEGRDPMPIEWASQLAMNPIAAIYVPGDTDELDPLATTPEAHMGDHFARDYAKFYRLGATGSVYEGCSYERPLLQCYDVEREKVRAIVARGDMGYGMPKNTAGSPIVDENGRLLGVIVGNDWGVDSSHAGFYTPIDLIRPCLGLLDAMVERMKNRDSEWRIGIDRVSHRSHDVYF